MATQELVSRSIVHHINDTGEEPGSELDRSLTLSGFSVVTAKRRITVAANAADVALTFTNAAYLHLYSHDNKFSLRLAAGGTLMENLMEFKVASNVATNSSLSTSVLLTGNGSTVADIEVWIVEKYTA